MNEFDHNWSKQISEYFGLLGAAQIPTQLLNDGRPPHEFEDRYRERMLSAYPPTCWIALVTVIREVQKKGIHSGGFGKILAPKKAFDPGWNEYL